MSDQDIVAEIDELIYETEDAPNLVDFCSLLEDAANEIRRLREAILMKAISVTSHTLNCPDDERPASYGSCFSVMCDDGKEYRVVNFVYENLKALEEQGLKWPLDVESLGSRNVVLMDGRIGERWYQQRYCEVCTPQSLLPITQRQRHQRDMARGRRIEGGGCITINLDVPEVPFP